MMSTKENVQVCVRVRPPLDKAASSTSEIPCVSVDDGKRINLRPQFDDGSLPASYLQYTFDFVADVETSQQEMFERVGQPIADSIFEGINGTIFAYGQTGSGKTFTIMGPDGRHTHPTLQGIAPRVLRYIFAQIESRELSQYQCTCSFLEIYNDTIHDLISGRQRLALREDKNGVYVSGLTETSVASASECLTLLSQGLKNRSVAATAANRSSSRSHSVLTLSVDFVTADAKGVPRQKRARLNLVDLAGSERQSKAKTSGTQLKEACAINQSLHHLGQVINSIAQKKSSRSHVNYRDSKLTFLLRDSLGGSSRTFVIATVSPSSACFGETMSTLQFATRAKEIKNAVSVNESTSPEQELQRLVDENKQLQRQLQLTLDRVDELEQASRSADVDPLQLEAFCPQCRAATGQQDKNDHDHDHEQDTRHLTPAKRGSVPPSPLRCSSPLCKASPRQPSDAEKLAMVMRCVESDVAQAKREKQLEEKYQLLLNYVSSLENANELLKLRLQAVASSPAESAAEYIDGDSVLSFLSEGDGLRDDSQLLCDNDADADTSAAASSSSVYSSYTRAQLIDEVWLLREQLDNNAELRRLELANRSLAARVEELEQQQLADQLDEKTDQVEQLRVLNRELLRQLRLATSSRADVGCSTPTRGLTARSALSSGKSRGGGGADEAQLRHKLQQSAEEVERLRGLSNDYRTKLLDAARQQEAAEKEMRSMKELLEQLETGDEAQLRRHFQERLDREIGEQREKFNRCAMALVEAQNECIAIKSENIRLKARIKQSARADTTADTVDKPCPVENVQPNDVRKPSAPLRRTLILTQTLHE